MQLYEVKTGQKTTYVGARGPAMGLARQAGKEELTEVWLCEWPVTLSKGSLIAYLNGDKATQIERWKCIAKHEPKVEPATEETS